MSNELGVIIKARDLTDYILLITDKSPKKFRMTLISRLVNLSLDIVENLYQAHQRAKAGKRYKKEIIEFDLQLYWELTRLQEQLQNGTYRMSEYREFVIHDPKERLIHAPAYRDRVMQHCFCDNILSPILEKRMIYDNAASRIGKGTHFAIWCAPCQVDR